MSLLTLGSVAFDDIETPFGKSDKVLGGSGTYISLAASYFHKPTNIISVVGEDFQNEDINMLEKHGVNTEGIQIKKGEKTFFWKGRYHNDLNTRDTLVTELNVLEDFDPVVPDSYQGCEYLMLGNATPMVQSTLIERLSKRPKFIAMDSMNLWIENTLDDLKKTLSMVDLVTINDEEARQLSGEASLVKAARVIQDMGPKYMIIKKGEHGALLFGEDQIFFAPALPLEEVFDPTGAGDTFAGGFIGYLAQTNDLSFNNMKRAVIYGSALASFCVEKFGPARLVDLSEKELQDRVQQFIELAQFEIKYS